MCFVYFVIITQKLLETPLVNYANYKANYDTIYDMFVLTVACLYLTIIYLKLRVVYLVS